jgi:hypothetical protein
VAARGTTAIISPSRLIRTHGCFTRLRRLSKRIDFAAAPVGMVAGVPQAPEMTEVFIPRDEIMVVFTAEKMRDIGFKDSEFLTARLPSRG